MFSKIQPSSTKKSRKVSETNVDVASMTAFASARRNTFAAPSSSSTAHSVADTGDDKLNASTLQQGLHSLEDAMAQTHQAFSDLKSQLNDMMVMLEGLEKKVAALKEDMTEK